MKMLVYPRSSGKARKAPMPVTSKDPSARAEGSFSVWARVLCVAQRVHDLFHEAGAELAVKIIEPRARGVDGLGLAEPVAQDHVALGAAQELGDGHGDGIRIAELAEQGDALCREIYRISGEKLDYTIGSALDLFGGTMSYEKVKEFCRE